MADKGTWDYVSSRLGKVDPETKLIAKEIYDAAKKAGHDIWFMWGMGTSADHKTGNALDLMVHNEAAGDFARNYIWQNRARLRLKHVIWEQHITSTVTNPGVRRKMEDRGNPTANHFDHPHALFFPGKYQTPPEAAKPSAPSNGKPASLIADGELGPKTISRWQEVMKQKVTGRLSSDFIKVVQARLKATVDNRLVVDGKGIAQNGLSYKTVGALQRYLKSPVTMRISPKNSNTIKALQRRLNEGRF